MKKIVVRFMVLMLAIMLAVGILGTGVCVGARAVRYMTRQNFTIGNAIEWSWDDFRQDLQRTFGNGDRNDGYIEGKLVVEDVKYLLRH